ncbi:translocation/assembly module TamB domain-containing protein, partial [Deferrisoma sp.]
ALRAALAADLGAGFELAWRLEAWDPAWLGDRVPEGIRLGPVSGEGSLTGDFGTPAGSWAFTWSGGTTALEAFGRALGPVALTLDGGGGGVRFGARAPDLGAEATGLQSWEGGWPLEAEVRAPALPLGRVVPGIEAGTASVEIRASAGVRAWLEGKTWPERLAGLGDLDGRLSWTGVRWNGREVPGGAAEVRTGPEGRAVEVRARGLDAKARLRDETSLAWEARAEAEGLDLSPWLPAGWSGRLSGRGEARGRGAAVERGEWRGRAEAVAGPWFGPLDAPLDLRWEGGRIVGRTGLGPELAVEGEWSPAGGARGRAVLRAFRPGRWMARERWPEDLDVSLDGELRAEAPAGAPVRAEMDLGGVAVDLPPLRLRNRGPVRIRWEGGALRLDQVWIEGGDVTLTASGLAGPGPGWDLRGKARCDLSMLARWIGPVESARGTLFADLEVTGPWSDPRFRGPIQVYPGAEARIRGVGLALSEAEASATLDPQDGLILEWFDAALGAGRIHVEGRMPLAGLVPTDVRLWVEVRDVDHEEPPGVRYAGDADLLVTGLPPGMRVVGEVRLERFRFTRRISWKTMLLDLLQRRPRKVESAAETSGVTLDIAVRGERDLRVENNLAEVDLAADLRVRGPATRPVLWGRLEVLAGEVQFRNTVYEMRRSSVEFLGDAGPMPLLDVHARAQVSGYQVNVDIIGPLDDYQVLLSSSPPLEYTDIVSLLTLGATSENLAGGQGVSAAEAASFLTGKVQDTLESGVGELLGVDQFHIDPAYSPAAQSTVPRVTIGKAITRDLYARYAATVGAEAAQDLEVQYRLSPHVSLLGTWSDRGAESSGSLGGEVRFRFTFR